MILNFSKILDKNKLSTKKFYVIKALLTIASKVAKDECSEEEIDKNFKKIVALDQSNILNRDDYLSEREALKYLDIDRNSFYAIKRKFKIKTSRFHNVPIGYYILDLDKIKEYLSK